MGALLAPLWFTGMCNAAVFNEWFEKILLPELLLQYLELLLKLANPSAQTLKLLAEARRDPPNPGNASERLPDEDNAVRLGEFLAGVEPRAARHPLNLTVAMQDSCHLRHAQRLDGLDQSAG